MKVLLQHGALRLAALLSECKPCFLEELWLRQNLCQSTRPGFVELGSKLRKAWPIVQVADCDMRTAWSPVARSKLTTFITALQSVLAAGGWQRGGAPCLLGLQRRKIRVRRMVSISLLNRINPLLRFPAPHPNSMRSLTNVVERRTITQCSPKKLDESWSDWKAIRETQDTGILVFLQLPLVRICLSVSEPFVDLPLPLPLSLSACCFREVSGIAALRKPLKAESHASL